MLDGLKRHATLRSLDMYRQNAFHLTDFQLERDRFVIFSDAHKGDKRQTLDEFQHNEQLYCHALNHYLNDDFGLILNGDMEEGWKNRYSRIMASYEHSVYALERGFAEQGVTRHLRIWGNHDNDWQNKSLVNKYLGGVLHQ